MGELLALRLRVDVVENKTERKNSVKSTNPFYIKKPKIS